MIKTILTGSLLAATGVAIADGVAVKAPATQRNFLACPIVMDTQDVPCWVAEHEGERYYLTVQTGRAAGAEVFPFSPMLNHRVLVEGTVSDEPRICGGIVLREAKFSPLEDLEPGCGKMIPGEGYSTRGSRPIGPDGDPPGPRESTAIRLNANGAVLPTREERLAAYNKIVAARQPGNYTINYFFNSNYLPFPVEQRTTDQAAQYAADVKATRVEIVGYRGATILSNGERLTEKPGLAQERAEKIAKIFEFFEVPRDKLHVTWKEEPEDQSGVKDYQRRRVTIAVYP